MRIDKASELEERAFLNTIQYIPSKGFKAIVQQDDDMEIVAMVGYDCWTPNSVQLHVWVPRPKELIRRFVREAFRYPFVMCNRGLVVGLTPSNNGAALAFNRHIGFRETHRVKDGWEPGVDVVLQEMRREECRWLRRR